METERNGSIGNIGTLVVAALAAALVAVFIAVSLIAGTLHVVAFFWCALLFGLMVSHLVKQVREIGKGRNGK